MMPSFNHQYQSGQHPQVEHIMPSFGQLVTCITCVTYVPNMSMVGVIT
jgi:hypothetical protein